MTLNEVLIRQNFINKLLIKNENVDVDKDLKVKIIMMRAKLNKYKTKFDNDCLNKISGLKTGEFVELESLKELSKDSYDLSTSKYFSSTAPITLILDLFLSDL